MSGLIYLASPYSHANPAVKENRFDEVCRIAGRLMRDGHCVFSPIAHSHSVELQFDGGGVEGHDFWLRQDFAILRHAEKLVVLKLYGWEESRGIAAEIDFATRIGIPVEYLEPLP